MKLRLILLGVPVLLLAGCSVVLVVPPVPRATPMDSKEPRPRFIPISSTDPNPKNK